MPDVMKLVRDGENLVLPLSHELVKKLNIELDDDLEIVEAEPGRLKLLLAKASRPRENK